MMNKNTEGLISELRSILVRSREGFANRSAWAEESDVVEGLRVLTQLEQDLDRPVDRVITSAPVVPETPVSRKEFAKEFLALASTPASQFSDLQWSYKKLARALGEDENDDGVKMALVTLTANYKDNLASYIKNRNPSLSIKALLQRVHEALDIQNPRGAKLLRDALRAYKLETD